MIDHHSTVIYTAKAPVKLKAEKKLGFNLTCLSCVQNYMSSDMHTFAHYTRNANMSILISAIQSLFRRYT